MEFFFFFCVNTILQNVKTSIFSSGVNATISLTCTQQCHHFLVFAGGEGLYWKEQILIHFLWDLWELMILIQVKQFAHSSQSATGDPGGLKDHIPLPGHGRGWKPSCLAFVWQWKHTLNILAFTQYSVLLATSQFTEGMEEKGWDRKRFKTNLRHLATFPQTSLSSGENELIWEHIH